MLNMSSNEIVIYTDGGCSGNPGPGGWGVVVIYNGQARQLSGGEKQRISGPFLPVCTGYRRL